VNISQLGAWVSMTALVVGGAVYAEQTYQRKADSKQAWKNYEIERVQERIDLINLKEPQGLTDYEKAQKRYYIDKRDNLRGK
jgi:hypothetical protein